MISWRQQPPPFDLYNYYFLMIMTMTMVLLMCRSLVFKTWKLNQGEKVLDLYLLHDWGCKRREGFDFFLIRRRRQRRRRRNYHDSLLYQPTNGNLHHLLCAIEQFANNNNYYYYLWNFPFKTRRRVGWLIPLHHNELTLSWYTCGMCIVLR